MTQRQCLHLKCVSTCKFRCMFAICIKNLHLHVWIWMQVKMLSVFHSKKKIHEWNLHPKYNSRVKFWCVFIFHIQNLNPHANSNVCLEFSSWKWKKMFVSLAPSCGRFCKRVLEGSDMCPLQLKGALRLVMLEHVPLTRVWAKEVKKKLSDLHHCPMRPWLQGLANCCNHENDWHFVPWCCCHCPTHPARSWPQGLPHCCDHDDDWHWCWSLLAYGCNIDMMAGMSRQGWRFGCRGCGGCSPWHRAWTSFPWL